MLNLFAIQWLALTAYFILRVWIGVMLILLSTRHSKSYRELVTSTTWPIFSGYKFPIIFLILSEFLLGAILILGAYTQIVVVLIFMMAIKMIIWRNRFTHPSIPDRWFYSLLIACCISIFITGAGAIAFDLPI